jgi:hypothetical protein
MELAMPPESTIVETPDGVHASARGSHRIGRLIVFLIGVAIAWGLGALLNSSTASAQVTPPVNLAAVVAPVTTVPLPVVNVTVAGLAQQIMAPAASLPLVATAVPAAPVALVTAALLPTVQALVAPVVAPVLVPVTATVAAVLPPVQSVLNEISPIVDNLVPTVTNGVSTLAIPPSPSGAKATTVDSPPRPRLSVTTISVVASPVPSMTSDLSPSGRRAERVDSISTVGTVGPGSAGSAPAACLLVPAVSRFGPHPADPAPLAPVGPGPLRDGRAGGSAVAGPGGHPQTDPTLTDAGTSPPMRNPAIAPDRWLGTARSIADKPSFAPD